MELLHASALHCHLQGALLVPSERCSFEEQSRECCGRASHRVTRHNTPIHNILSTAPQLRISQKALGTLPEDGNVMPKHVGATILNKLNEWLLYLLVFYAHINEMHGSRSKIPVKILVRQRCAKGFNSGVRGLTISKTAACFGWSK
jgi:hypothetical protein